MGYRALLIANSSFPADPHNLQPLVGPVNDVAVLRAALADAAVGLFEPESVRLVPERTAQEVLVELERFFSAARRDDTLLLYYSGHGVLNERNQLFLCARDTRTDLLKSTGVGATAINQMLEESAARTTVIVLDCCHSGAFKGGNLADSLRGSGRYLVTSCRSSDLASDAARDNTTSVFTSHLVEGLLRGAPDSNRDGYADLSDVYQYVYDRLIDEGRQIPQRSFAGGGDVAIARRAAAAPTVGSAGAVGPSGPAPAASAGVPPPALELSKTTIDLGELRPGDDVPVEHVFVLGDDDGVDLDWVARTADEWIAVEPHPGFFTLRFEPRPGLNRGRVVVRDRTAGTSQVVRVTVRLSEVRPGAVEGGRAAPAAVEEAPAEPEVAGPVAAPPPSVATAAQVAPAGVEPVGGEPVGVGATAPVPALAVPAVPVEAPVVPVEAPSKPVESGSGGPVEAPSRPVEAPSEPVESEPVEPPTVPAQAVPVGRERVDSGPAGGAPGPRRRGVVVAGVAVAVALVAIVAGLALRGGGEGAGNRATPAEPTDGSRWST